MSGRFAGARALLLTLATGVFVVTCTQVNLDAGRAYPCAPDGGGEQCPSGWRCGLEGQCHEEGVAASYACADDSHCESGWRCGAEGRCVAPTAPLRATVGLGQPVVERYSPQLPLGKPDVVAVSPHTAALPNSCGYQSYVVASAQGGTLTHVAFYDDRHRAALPDGGFLGADACAVADTPVHRVQMDTLSWPLEGQTVDLAVLNDTVYQLRADGTLAALKGAAPGPLVDGGVVSLGFPATTLRLKADPEPLLIAYSADRYALLGLPALNVLHTGQVLGTDGGARTIKDMLALGWESRSETYVMAATPEGLYLRGADAGGFPDSYEPSVRIGKGRWDSVHLPNGPGCDPSAGSSFAPEALHLAEPRTWHLAVEMSRGGAGRSIGLYVPGDNWVTAACVQAPTSPKPGVYAPFINESPNRDLNCANGIFDVTFGPGEGVFPIQPNAAYELACMAADGGFEDLLIGTEEATSGYQRRDELSYHSVLFRDARSNRSLQGREVYADAYGFRWVADDGANTSDIYPTRTNRRALLLDRLPSGITGGDQGLRVFAPRQEHGERPLDPTTAVGLRGEPFRFSPGAGLVAIAEDLSEVPFANGFEGAPYLSVGYFQSPQIPQGFAAVMRFEPTVGFLALFPSGETFRPPFHGSVIPSQDGGTYVVVTSADALLAGDVTREFAAGGVEPEDDFSALEVRITPSPRTPITSLTVFRPVVDGTQNPDFADGYVVSGRRLYRVRASSPLVWRSEELTLGDGEASEVWRDGPRPRAGLRDGRILALPDRVPLAPPLPESGAYPAVDFVHRCGHNFVLSGAGLFWLEVAEDAPQGEWRKVELPAGRPELLPLLRGGKLYATESAVLLFLSTGEVLRVGGLACAAE